MTHSEPTSSQMADASAAESLPATFIPEGPADFFDELQALAADAAVPHFYRLLGQTLRRAAETATAFNGLTLGGLHAKVDFLCKEHGIPPVLRHAVNVARRAILRAEQGNVPCDDDAVATDTLLQRLTDLKAVCRFIARVFDVPLPASLVRTFVADAPESEAPAQRIGQVLRCVAERWDETVLHVRADALGDDGADVVLKGRYADWSYLLKILTPGAQLNLVRPVRLSSGSIDAEVIVLEPDFLIDVTAVARCFEEYSHTPFNHLLQRLEPFRTSKEVLLGNFAGMLLDHAVYGRSEAYDEVFRTFVSDNILDILALEDRDGFSLADFYAEGKIQAEHIHVALHEALARHVGQYRPEEVMLEPSFVCEMLGLQGRMDFLQLDHRVLIEQKSGKGAFAPWNNNPERPVQKEMHYVQMLLYRAILRYGFAGRYAANGKNLQAFLLYSRYALPLLGLGAAPELFYEAMRVRNGMVWYEQHYCNGGARLLERITPESLLQRAMNPRFWQQYIRPRIASTLATFQQATPLERAYYLRFLRFLALEHRTAKVGDNTSQCRAYASKWNATLAEKHESGEIYDGLRLLPPDTSSTGTVTHVRLAFPAADTPAATDPGAVNFRRGDIVILYPYDADTAPDCRRSHIFRGVLNDIRTDGLEVRLTAPQGDARVLLHDAGRPWAIEHDLHEAAFTQLYAGLTAFLRAPQERRELLLLQRPPRTDTTLQLRGDYGPFNDMVLRSRQARDLFLIVGPPGTGKTSYGMLLTLQEELQSSNSRVLLAAYTNRAVDEACSKLLEAHIPFLRIGSAEGCDAACRPYLMDEQLRGLDADAARRRLLATRVVAGTVSALARRDSLFALLRFSLAIVDEASQILEPQLLPLLSAMHGTESAIARMVMIGDPRQLPAVVQQPVTASAVDDTLLQGIGLHDCRASLFERLLRRYGTDPRCTFMLTRQGRMHRDIAAFPSRWFYDGQLDVVPLPHQTAVTAAGDSRVMFYDVPAPKSNPGVVESPKVNVAEARAIAVFAVDVYETVAATFSAERTLGIIVPYRNQISAIRSQIEAECRRRHISGSPLEGVSIDTVERYQGSQRESIIYGFTVMHRWQLAFLTGNVFTDEAGNVVDRKLNVAMTRARSKLILVGNSALLERIVTFRRLIDDVKQQGGYRRWEEENDALT